jgi:hypothetical protein
LVKFEVVQETKCINQSVLKEKKEEQTLNVSKIKDKIYVTVFSLLTFRAKV